jgi:BlaI family penicillinase repressor
MDRTPVPTVAEMEILTVLWRLGQATVRQAHNAIRAARDDDRGYSTTLKLMQIMQEKGLVTRDDSVRPQLYRAARPPDETQRQVVADVRERVFGGSLSRLVLQALSTEKVSKSDLQKVHELLERMEKRR